jgi:hypothetical protein
MAKTYTKCDLLGYGLQFAIDRADSNDDLPAIRDALIRFEMHVPDCLADL